MKLEVNRMPRFFLCGQSRVVNGDWIFRQFFWRVERERKKESKGIDSHFAIFIPTSLMVEEEKSFYFKLTYVKLVWAKRIFCLVETIFSNSLHPSPSFLGGGVCWFPIPKAFFIHVHHSSPSSSAAATAGTSEAESDFSMVRKRRKME